MINAPMRIMGETTVTALRVDKELWKTAKKQAIDEGITLTELFNQAIKARIKK